MCSLLTQMTASCDDERKRGRDESPARARHSKSHNTHVSVRVALGVIDASVMMNI